jgi:hypothetical protein
MGVGVAETDAATFHSVSGSVLALSGVERAWLLHGAAMAILGMVVLVGLGPGLAPETSGLAGDLPRKSLAGG